MYIEKIPQRIYSISLNILFITLAAYLSINGFYKIFTAQIHISDMQQVEDSFYNEVPETPKNHSLKHYQSIIDRNLFNIKEKKVEPEVAKKPEISSLEETRLKIRLYGTVTGKKSYAVIRDMKQRKQKLYAVGDVVQDAFIKQILRDKIVLTVNGKDEILNIEKKSRRYSRTSASTRSVSKSGTKQHISISRSTIDNAMSNINSLMSQAKIRPHFKNGKPDGLTLSRIRRNSIFQKLGLRSGDILTGINGEDIRSVDDALGFYNSLKNSSDLTIQIKRRGRIKDIEYSIR